MTPDPFRPPWRDAAPVRVEDLVEHYRVGEWTLRATPAAGPNPAVLHVRRDRPGFPREHSAGRSVVDGWSIEDDGERFVTREGPLACLEWWAARHK